jgi:peptide/nickel transport system ATP-binding protein
VPDLLPTADGSPHRVRCWLHHPLPERYGSVGGESSGRAGVSPASGSGPERVTAEPRGAANPSAVPAQPRTAPMPARSLLDIRHLHVRFPQRGGFLQRITGHFHAVKDVSLSIGAGRTLALVGESGCGKTTLGKAVVQLLRGVADIEGQALLDGSDLFTLQGEALKAARRQVQIVFQDPFASLNPRLRVAEILDEGAAALGTEPDRGVRQQRIRDLCERVGLRGDALQRYPHEFSGGQRQRIAIARALAVEPRLIICDEPTSALDVSVQAQILNLLEELQRTLQVSYLFITHNIGVVEYLADDVAVMRAGQIEEAGPAVEVLSGPRSAYTRQLMAAVPRRMRT